MKGGAGGRDTVQTDNSINLSVFRVETTSFVLLGRVCIALKRLCYVQHSRTTAEKYVCT